MSSPEVPAQLDPLDKIFAGLKNKNPEVRLQSAQELRKHVRNVVVEMSSDAAAKLWEELTNKRLIPLAHGQTSSERLGAIVAIEHLLDLEKEETIETKRNCFRFYNYVAFALPSPDYNVMQTAAEALGKIVQFGGSLFDEAFMELEVAKAIELMQSDRQEPGRYAGVLILKELALHNPILFNKHILLVFEKLLIPLRDSRLIVREAAADLLAACLDIITQRERQAKAPFLTKILQDAQAGLRTASAEAIHGSLLTYRVLLMHAGMFMKEAYVDTAETILKLRSHRDALVRKTIIALIPTLALYDTQTFSEYFMHKAMGHLLEQLNRPAERSVAFTAIGQVATSVGSDMKQFLEPIMDQIKQGLQLRGKKNAPSEEPMFQCIGMLASAVGPNLTKLLHDQLDLMFACGLSEPLRQVLVAIARHIPPLLRTIQDRLLDLISLTLSGQNYKPLGAPPTYQRPEMAAIKDIAVQQTGATKAPAEIRLALDTLGSFDFSGHILNEFVRSCAVPYLEDDHPDIRQAAALTCCRLFVRDPICHQVSNHSIEIISDVLDKLLTVGIADPDPAIRLTVLSSLDERFDKHLSQAENVRSLFIALNDEVFENRVTAIGLVGRLAIHNPAYVMASLRKALIQLLTELEYSTVVRAREECTKLLSLLINATQRLIKPYAVSMLVTLLPKANDPNPTVSANILTCLGELSCVGGDDVLPLVPQLMNTILERLTDPVPVKRDAALRTQGQICSSTGYVIQPLIDHPELLQILGRILKTDAAPAVRREVIKVLGILGAIDPYRRKTRPDDDQTSETSVQSANTVLPSTTSSTSDDYFQTVVIGHLLTILRDQALSQHHHTVIEAIMSIFKTQGLKCVSFLPQIIPAFAHVTRNAKAARNQEFHLQQLAILIGIIKEHVRNYTFAVFNLAQNLWDNAALQLPIVGLIEALGKALGGEFKPFLPTILPLMLRVFDGDLLEKKQATQMKVLDAFLTFGANIEEYLHLVIPIIVQSYERQDASIALRKKAVQTIDGLTRCVNFSDHASRIIHPLVRALTTQNNELRTAVMEALSSLVLQLGSDFAIFVPTINKALLKNRVHNAKYEALITKLLNGERLPTEGTGWDVLRLDASMAPEFAPAAESTKMTVNQQHLKQAWDVSQAQTREDWNEWMHGLSVELMKESPSHALRACMRLVGDHPPLARALFNAAFLSCWTELYDQYQEDLVRAIEQAITSPTIPTDLAHRLLNLAEFMEHEDKPLPIENRTLGEYALKFHAYAKALHYKELEFFTETSPAIIEDLIMINTSLQQHDAAWGTLTLAREQYDVSKHEEWYERLGRWSEALLAYDRKAREEPNSQEPVWGKMRCLHALGEWEQLAAQVDENWANATNEQRRDMAGMGAAAAWSLNEWDNMDDFIAAMKGDSPDRSFYKAILAVHRNQFSKALTHIMKARDLLDPELTALVGESYGRTYNIMVRAQMLSELEEIIQYKQYADQPERQAYMKRTWMKRFVSNLCNLTCCIVLTRHLRLQGCQPEVEVWQRVLQVRTLVSQPEDDSAMWIKFANLCRKSDRMVLADKTINSLLCASTAQYKETAHVKAAPDVVYAQLKFMWANDAKEESYRYLQTFTSSLAHDLSEAATAVAGRPTVPKRKLEDMSKLLARCYYKQGQWQHALRKNVWSEDNIKDILQAYYFATHYDTTWYKAWHTWALANFEVVGYLENRTDRADALPGTNLAIHVVQAVQGFFRSIQLRNENALQDTLRLLTLWFKFGSHDEVSAAMATGFSIVDVDTWLDVVPQIIARIQTPSTNIRRNIDMLLTEVGKHHPQALIYPLTVASQSSSLSRKNAALAIMDRMRDHSATIVEQALLVSQELIRVAILWHELWHEGLEEASRLYYTEKNPEGMIAVLEPLHEKLEKGPTTTRETSFTQVFGRDLREAREASRRYLRYGDPTELDKAWEIYYTVFRKIEKQMPQLVTLDLQYVSPELLKARNLDLAVPGTYQSGSDVITIVGFTSKLTVISSKQRPRRLSVKGSDGRDYNYLLKGHEDLRQDERVMQLFSLVNTLLSIDTASFKRRLHIQRYSVIPLAPNAGLIGWVQDSDTLHVLVRDYRDSRKILLNIEYRLMLQMAPDYESLILLQKVEVFEYALDNTTGQDLYRVLWLKSQNSEHWLERRATYTRSLAVNSMVGHILGLGDRHPSNVLLERQTGKVVHIDFGDCFEVAMLREKFPEKVPFRLTRMLTHAMEVSGIQGSFKNTCEISMQVLRDNKESLMAVLEAFVYDPLINWRLLQADVNNRGDDANDATRAEQLARVSGYPQGPTRKLKADENEIFNEALGEPGARQEVRNERALFVYNRVQHKLTGRDFNPDVELTVPQQVEKLISQATSLENLCQCFSGWCAFW
ncbi:atypical/PIKK/FRAP protein kinase [Fomitiporia mediterranea MF3/22]|uniref:atypical/PIKK/FRAP protein kinase n=1 Tax=Fomitiporia mediterranea (strain MF3/22) TaxID=694068 RepID=UPI00044087AA|nr:atypical/PIKK/FRAP protein kinase [Fomitiporia mediterranea MF3/22]EJD07323.1 atypical/PIKK/FRAP protein kinase [Fomitiporia mediterranea MF3/22]